MIYIEHEDGFNGPIIRCYHSEDEVLDGIMDDRDRKDARNDLFGQDGGREAHVDGEIMRLVNEQSMLDRAAESLRIAKLMRIGSNQLYSLPPRS